MLENQKKCSVYLACLKNEKGFTFLSMIIAITIIVSLLPLLAYVINTAKFSTNYDELSINQFFIFFRNEFIEATDYKVSPQKVTLYLKNGKKASFEMYDQLILRRIDGGYEVYLRDVKDVLFTQLPYGVQTTITSTKGEQYEKAIVFYQ